MIKLLKLEYYKNLNYKPFKVFTILYFAILIALLFIGLVDFDVLGGTVNLKNRGFIISRKSGTSPPGLLPY
ncbi:hypothetical protein OWR28_25670 [Chryseobacterium sp. 1B4]